MSYLLWVKPTFCSLNLLGVKTAAMKKKESLYFITKLKRLSFIEGY